MSEGSGGCTGSMCRCLASIPCGVLCVFLTFISAVIACGSSLIIAMHRTRQIINEHDLWPWFMYACIGVAVGLLLVAVLYLIVVTVSSKHTDSRPFISSRQLRCLRVTNCVMMVLAVLLQFVWIVVTIVLSVPVLYLLLIDQMIDSGAAYVNLKHYVWRYIFRIFRSSSSFKVTELISRSRSVGKQRQRAAVPKRPKQLLSSEDESLTEFKDDIMKSDLLICYSISLVTSLIIVISLGLFLLTVTSYFARLGQQTKSPGRSGRDHYYYDGQSVPHETAM